MGASGLSPRDACATTANDQARSYPARSMLCLAVLALLVIAVFGRLKLVITKEPICENPCKGTSCRNAVVHHGLHKGVWTTARSTKDRCKCVCVKVPAHGKTTDYEVTRALKHNGRWARMTMGRRSSSHSKSPTVQQLPSPGVYTPDSGSSAIASQPMCALHVTSFLDAALAGCRLAKGHPRREQQRAAHRVAHSDTSRMDIVLLTCTRVKLLALVLRSIEAIAPPDRIRLQIWVDTPETNRERRHPVLSLVHAVDRNRVWPSVKVVVFERHMGTRAMWLTALSIRRPQLILEDDVVLLPGAFQWYMWSIEVMSTRHDIFGSSFHRQTQVALVDRGGTGDAKLDSAVPYTYPMVGSHGFMLSMHVYDAFFALLHTRKEKDLYSPDLDGFISTKWYRDFKRQNKSEERMWTQEMVLFAFRNNKTALYPATDGSFAVHCAKKNAEDTVRGKWPCNDWPVFSSSTWVPPVFNQSRISTLDWGATCLGHCRPTVKVVRRTTERGPLLTKLRGEIAALKSSWDYSKWNHSWDLTRYF